MSAISTCSAQSLALSLSSTLCDRPPCLTATPCLSNCHPLRVCIPCLFHDRCHGCGTLVVRTALACILLHSWLGQQHARLLAQSSVMTLALWSAEARCHSFLPLHERSMRRRVEIRLAGCTDEELALHSRAICRHTALHCLQFQLPAPQSKRSGRTSCGPCPTVRLKLHSRSFKRTAIARSISCLLFRTDDHSISCLLFRTADHSI